MIKHKHEQACIEKVGKTFSEVHDFLDQYNSQFPGINRRRFLHHQHRITLVVNLFGEEARGPAEQHIELARGLVPESWVEMDKYFFPLSLEEAAIEAELVRLLDNR